VATRLAEFPERSDLTERELEILRLVSRGLSNKGVAKVIGRMDETVKIHLTNIFAKLGVADRTEAVTVAFARGLIHLEVKRATGKPNRTWHSAFGTINEAAPRSLESPAIRRPAPGRA
jgi:DNA-binding CsgD family transcriptional regulator